MDVNKSSINQQRRAAILGSAVGAAGMMTWHKPIINAIILPTHAQMSVATSFFGSSVTTGPILAQSFSPLSLLISEANAGVVDMESTYAASVVANGVDNYDVGIFENRDLAGFDQAQFLYQGTLNTSSGGTLVLQSPCSEAVSDITASLVSADDSQIVLNFINREQSITVPAGEGVLPMPECIPSFPTEFGLIAEDQGGGDTVSMIARFKETNIYTVYFQDDSRSRRWSGDVAVGGGLVELAADPNCVIVGGRDVSIEAVDEYELELRVSSDGFDTFYLEPGNFMLPDIGCDP